MVQIVDKFIAELRTQLADRKVTLQLDESAREYLARKGYDPMNGARPLARVIQEEVKRPLTDELLFGKLAHGGRVRLGAENEHGVEKITFEVEATTPAAAAVVVPPALAPAE
jgi:ATP-dependent Clp protease ATP-binding subunit ClpA